jgi:signal transduction histidine kinase
MRVAQLLLLFVTTLFTVSMATDAPALENRSVGTLIVVGVAVLLTPIAVVSVRWRSRHPPADHPTRARERELSLLDSNCERAYQTAVESQQPFALEYRVQRPDGNRRWLLGSTSLDITERQLYEKRLRDLTVQLVTAQEDERRRIARELHDDVNQRIALLAIGIDHVRSTALDEGSRGRLRDLWLQTTAISKAVHSLSHELHSSTLDALGLVPAIRTLSRELSATGLRVKLIAEDDCCELSPAAALGLFRIIQEALSNVLKHSGAKDAVVTVRKSQDTARVCIEDDGRGFDPAIDAGGIGLHSMRERLTPMGGQVWIRSRPGEGTKVEARVPRTKPSTAAPICAA